MGFINALSARTASGIPSPTSAAIAIINTLVRNMGRAFGDAGTHAFRTLGLRSAPRYWNEAAVRALRACAQPLRKQRLGKASRGGDAELAVCFLNAERMIVFAGIPFAARFTQR